jgi:putative thioredoxin
MALFGLGSTTPATPKATENTGYVFDITTEEFQSRVVEGSMQVPILVDFWAPWCGPCKQLMPILEAEVNAANSEVLMAKVNIDENPELAQALRIQSVPTVMAFFQGQPVTAFSGARPASDIKNLIAQLVKLARSSKPDALDIPAALKQAAQLVADNVEERFVQELYGQILQQDPNNIEAYNGMIRSFIRAGAIEHAQFYIDQAPETISKNPAFASARTALDIALKGQEAAGTLGSLEKRVKAQPDDYQARFDLAVAQFAAGQKGEAIDNLLDLFRRDRTWNDEAARKELLRYFEALGFADPLSIEGRKKLSRILFS